MAKAFRLGANLVLTKPIHVEQSKGTLRVARGLLRKGQAAKAAAAAPGAAAPTMFAQPSVPAPFPPPQKSAAPPSLSASAFELDAEPMPLPDAVDAALLEYMPDSPVSSAENSTPAAAESDPSKQYPWQPRKPLAEPMASALRRAAEAAGKSEFDAAAPRPTAASQSATPQATSPQAIISQSTISQGGMASAGFAQTRRARPLRRPGPRKFRLPMPRSWVWNRPRVQSQRRPQKRHRLRGSKIRRRATDGIRTRRPAPTEAPAFTSLDDGSAGFRRGRQQEDPADRGGGARTRGRRLFRLDQDAVCASPASSAAIGSSGRPGDVRPASAAHRFGPRDATRDGRCSGAADGTRFEWHNRRSFYVQAFSCGGRGGSGGEDTSTGQD